MEERRQSVFVADVHLGLRAGDPAEREARFVRFLKGLSASRVKTLYLLGDIWDFWYEYRDVIPKEGIRVVAQLIRLMDEGVQVVFFPGNHDLWSYSFFEQIGIRKMEQPSRIDIDGHPFCLGHGDGLGGGSLGYRLLLWVFHNRTLQRLFSALHPTLAFRFGTDWSNTNRRSHGEYHFRGSDEPLYRFAVKEAAREKTEYFVFGHYHDAVDMRLPDGARLVVLKDWIGGGTPHAVFYGETLSVSSF